MSIAINTNGNWRIWWGPGPTPVGATAHGTVTRDGYDTGALIEMPTGIYVQGNASSMRSLPQRDVIVSLHQSTIGRTGGKAASGEAKRRGDSEYYREISRKAVEARRRKRDQ